MEVIIGVCCLVAAFFILLAVDYEISVFKLKNSYRKFIKSKNRLKKILGRDDCESTSKN